MISPKHPRFKSLKTREKIVNGVKMGITSLNGLIAQGRGEAFDYLIGEKTHDFAKKAIKAAASLLLSAKRPVLCVNGNSAALVPDEYITISNLLNCPIEVNLFHKSIDRELKIKQYLEKKGAKNVLISDNKTKIKGIASERKFVNPEGIAKSDVVFVPLEDGDRTEELVKLNKKVITVDLNPMSRTSQMSSITMVDNIIRALPSLTQEIKRLQKLDRKDLEKIINDYSNKKTLSSAEKLIRQG